MMTRNINTVLKMLALAAMTAGCEYVYGNPIEWEEGNDLIGHETDPLSTDSTDGRETTDDSETTVEVGCEDGWQSEDGVCVFPLAENRRQPTSIALDETHVYWTEWGSRDALANYLENGGVYRAPKEGGEVEILAENLYMPANIQLDDTNVYWLNSNNDMYGTNNAVMLVAKQGGTSTTLAANLPQVTGLVVSDEGIYYAVHSNPDETGSTIMSIPKNLGDSVNDTNIVDYSLFWEEDGNISQLAISPDGLTLYWNTSDSYPVEDSLKKMPIDKSAKPSIVGYPGRAGKLTVDDVAVYCLVAPAASGTALRMFEFADEPSFGLTLAFADWSMGAVALWDDNVYWTRDNDGMVTRSSKTPGESVVLIENQNYPVDIAVDEDAVYWINSGDDSVIPTGGVYKMARE